MCLASHQVEIEGRALGGQVSGCIVNIAPEAGGHRSSREEISVPMLGAPPGPALETGRQDSQHRAALLGHLAVAVAR